MINDKSSAIFLGVVQVDVAAGLIVNMLVK